MFGFLEELAWYHIAMFFFIWIASGMAFAFAWYRVMSLMGEDRRDEK